MHASTESMGTCVTFLASSCPAPALWVCVSARLVPPPSGERWSDGMRRASSRAMVLLLGRLYACGRLLIMCVHCWARGLPQRSPVHDPLVCLLVGEAEELS